MKDKNTILCLCDGGSDIGFGHVSRCLALAEVFNERGCSVQVAGRLRDGAEEMAAQAGFRVRLRPLFTGRDCPSEAALLCYGLGAFAAVIDSYNLQPGYLRRLSRDLPILLVDDFGALDEYCGRAILNPSIEDHSACYPPGFLVMSGPRYIPFRRAFRQRRPPRWHERKAVRRVLVTMGGGDPQDMTWRVLRALQAVAPEVTVHAVVGRGYTSSEGLIPILDRCGPDSRLMVQLPTLAEEMANADLCVCAGGMTKYEACYLGVPCLAISQTEAQASETRRFGELGLLMDLGLATELEDAKLRQVLAVIVSGHAGRAELGRRAWEAFPPDPTQSIVEAFFLHLEHKQRTNRNAG